MQEFLLKTTFSFYGYIIVTNFQEFLYSLKFEFFINCEKSLSAALQFAMKKHFAI